MIYNLIIYILNVYRIMLTTTKLASDIYDLNKMILRTISEKMERSKEYKRSACIGEKEREERESERKGESESERTREREILKKRECVCVCARMCKRRRSTP